MSDYIQNHDGDQGDLGRTRNVPGTKLQWRRKSSGQTHRRENTPSKFNGIHRRRRKKIRL